MLEKSLLLNVEQALSAVWGSDVRLSFEADFDEHPHVARLTVIQAPPSAPSTVILKRWRVEGEERYDPSFSSGGLFNDWASMEFLANVMGNEARAPHVYAGNQDAGFIVMEDLTGQYPLAEALRNGDSVEATQALIEYGKLLALLHGKTAGHFDLYSAIRKRLSNDYHVQPENYFECFEAIVADLRRIAIEVPPAALRDIHEAARHLSHPGEFIAFTHGDPVFGNIIDRQGRWHLIDFEVARLRHALYEGTYLRMLFPTSGLMQVQRIPEPVWRQAEAAYRTRLSEFLPIARDNSRYGPATTAACAFWILSFCGGWLERARGGELTADRLSHVRRCLIARCELFVATTQEFQSLGGLGEFVASLVNHLRSQWPEADCDLPLYPAFVRTDSQ
jgi:tRNA A-37 threonylcarbamoyl transferase component Bud32